MDRIEKIFELLQQSPEDNFLRHALGLEYIKLGNDIAAKRLFIDMLTISPGYIGSYYHLAKLLERNQEIETAIEWYEKGMQEASKAKDNHAFNELQSAYEDLID